MALTLANQARSLFRTALNTILATLESASLSNTAPSAPLAGRIWLDSSVAGTWTKKRWTGSAWCTEGSIDTATAIFTPANSNVIAPGIMVPYAGATAPTGWLLCYGQAVNRTTYAALFAAIGTAHGAGDGSTTFNVPDRRGRASFGKDNMGGSAAGRLTSAGSGIDGTALGAVGGAQTVTLDDGDIPTLTVSGGTTVTKGDPLDGSTEYGFAEIAANAGSVSVGGGTVGSASPTAVNKMPPAAVDNIIIKT